MNSVAGIHSAYTRFGHGTTHRHQSLIRSDWEGEYRRLVRHKPNDPRVKGKSLADFIADKEAARGDKKHRK